MHDLQSSIFSGVIKVSGLRQTLLLHILCISCRHVYLLQIKWSNNKSLLCSGCLESFYNCGSERVNTKKMTTNVRESVLTVDNINPGIRDMEYVVRGAVVIRASEIEKELQQGVKKPFYEVIKTSIGDCHAMGQPPITFVRQVLALVSYPALMDDDQFPCDVKQKAQTILDACRGGSVGSYSDSPGIEMIRRHCAEFIEERDGFPSVWQNIILSNGASEGIKSVMSLMIGEVDGKKPGIMVPIPQYPLYSALIIQSNMHQIGYYLDESKDWRLTVQELKRAVNEARKVSFPRGIVIINPGNPTGQVLTKENIQEIIKFAYDQKLFIFADEVYQQNIYCERSKFHSFKKVMNEMGLPYSGMEIASFMSCSKGYLGECGLRGGYSEVVNMHPDVLALLLKSVAANLPSTVLGQAAIECMVKPPKLGDESYDLFTKEKTRVLSSLAKRAKIVEDTLNSMDGISCNAVQGAMYAFPQIELPSKAIAMARSKGQAPDVYYASELLEKTGVCVVPGSGFGQKKGTYHFRTTILPPPEKLMVMLDKVRNFHTNFLSEHQ